MTLINQHFGVMVYREVRGFCVDFQKEFTFGSHRDPGTYGAVFFWTQKYDVSSGKYRYDKIEYGILFGDAQPNDGTDGFYPSVNPPLDQPLHRAFLSVCDGAPPEPFLDLLVEEYPQLEKLVNTYLGV